MKRFFAVVSAGALMCALVAMAVPRPAVAWFLEAHTWEFIGAEGDCGTNSPPGSNIIVSVWLNGIGLPDNGGGNTTNTLNPTNPGTKGDPHQGLLLGKNGPTSDCSSSGASIWGVEGMTVYPGFYLGFDYRNGGHCGGGAPRFNVNYTDSTGTIQGSSFVGNCSLATTTQAVQDPLEWTTLRWTATSPAQSFPAIPIGSIITSIDVVFDEGTDTVGAEDPRGIGLATIDNININGEIIRNGP
jgi:hypothetical protein